MSLTPWTRQEEWYQQIINASTGKYLPSVSAQDAGKVLAVGSDGGWVAQGYLELSGTVADGAITITTSPLPSIDDVADAYKSGKGVLIHFPTANILLVPFYSEDTQGFDSYTFGGTGADYDGFKFRATVIFSNRGGSLVCYGTIVELRPFAISLIPQNPDLSGIMSDNVANITNAIREGRDIVGVIESGNVYWDAPMMSMASIDGYEYPRLEWWIVYDGKLGCLYVNQTNDPDENTYSVTTYDITDKAISTTYDAIKGMRDSGNLVKGATYRMTDYVTKINGTYDLSTIGASGYVHVAKSAEHPFDLLLYAIDESHLSEIAKATWHDGDSYFADAKVNAWDIRYCLDNDTTRFSWADTEDGKGVIYWMRDEWDNECGYDFKNVLTVRYALTADSGSSDSGLEYNAETSPNRYGSPYHVFLALREYMGTGTYVNPLANAHYDFSVGANILGTVQMPTLDSTYLETFQADLYYTFDYYDVDGNHNDATLNNVSHVCRNNKIERSEDPLIQFVYGQTNTFGLDCICFESNGIETPSTVSIEDNVIKSGCAYSTFGSDCCKNSIGANSFGNVFGSLFVKNSMASNCEENIFSFGCQRNNFFARSYKNVFALGCSDNSFLSSASNNYFDGHFSSNIICGNMDANVFGNNCTYNTFGRYISGNTFGNYLSWNTFGDSFMSNTVESQFLFNTFNGNNQGVAFYRAAGDGDVRYYNIGKGVSNANLFLDLGRSCEQYIGYNSLGELVTWCPADLVH